MTAAVALAGAAGVCAATAIADLAGIPRRAPARRHRAGGRLGTLTIALAQIARRAGARGAPGALHARLAAAGDPLGLTGADVVALKAAGAAVGLLLALALAGALPGRLGIALVLAAPAGGFRAPDVALARRARARDARVRQELADVLDLLRVAVEAGLPVGRALAEVGRRCGGLLGDELGAVATRMTLGASRAEALDVLLRRCPAGGVVALAAAMGRADRHGAPLAPALQALAAEARAEQARRLRDASARAAPKIQLVVALVLVPAVMLLVAAVLARTLVPGG
ncbi:MAG: tight adherence protein [Solirubrobacteraceae bacterium]|nr:tight adherence protein [Solirubrobacteraceae bacterium]